MTECFSALAPSSLSPFIFPNYHCDLFHAPASPMCLFKLELSQLLLFHCNRLHPCSIFVTALLSHLVWSITCNNLYHQLSQCCFEWIFLYCLDDACWLLLKRWQLDNILARGLICYSRVSLNFLYFFQSDFFLTK